MPSVWLSARVGRAVGGGAGWPAAGARGGAPALPRLAGPGVAAVGVLLEVDPEAGEGVGRVVGVGDDFVVGEDLGGGVDGSRA
jgi:hypothetical protein